MPFIVLKDPAIQSAPESGIYMKNFLVYLTIFLLTGVKVVC